MHVSYKRNIFPSYLYLAGTIVLLAGLIWLTTLGYAQEIGIYIYIMAGLAFLHALWYVVTPVVKIVAEEAVIIKIDMLISWQFNLSEISAVDYSDRKKLGIYLKNGKIRFLRLRYFQPKDRAAFLKFMMRYITSDSAQKDGNA